MHRSRARLVARAPGPVLLLAICGFGAWVRWSGFTSSSLWFDDAWTAMPARVGLRTAVRMITTAPGFTLGLRSWLRLGPSATWWAQLPAFATGVLGIVAVFALLTFFRAWRPLRYLGALAIAASPVAANYSTRVKQFSWELLLACLVLWLLERWRRDPSARTALAAAAAGVASLLFSFTTLTVVVASGAAAVVWALRDARPWARRGAAVIAGSAAATCAAGYVLWLRHLSPSLHYGWTHRGYLLSTASLHRVAFSLEAMGTGIFHWMLGWPTARGRVSTAVTPAGLALAGLAAVVLAAIALPPVLEVLRRRATTTPPLLASSLAVALALALAVAGRSPFGAGRTDEVLYPSILLLAAGALTRLVERGGASAARVGLVGALCAAGCLLGVGATNRAAYPVTALRPLVAKLLPKLQRGDVVVVDPWVTFTWAYDQVTPTSVSFRNEPLPWSQGFHVVSRDPRVDISTWYFFPDASYPTLSQRTHRIWYVAATVGRQSPLANHPNHLEVTENYTDLKALGWRRAGVYLTAAHTEAVLLVYAPRGR